MTAYSSRHCFLLQVRLISARQDRKRRISLLHSGSGVMLSIEQAIQCMADANKTSDCVPTRTRKAESAAAYHCITQIQRNPYYLGAQHPSVTWSRAVERPSLLRVAQPDSRASPATGSLYSYSARFLCCASQCRVVIFGTDYSTMFSTCLAAQCPFRLCDPSSGVESDTY